MSENKEEVVEKKRNLTGTLNSFIYKSGMIAAKTAVGVGAGAVAGFGAIAALATAEITIPALIVLKTFGFAGGAIGFLNGLAKKG
ncbi:MAG TPA: hypothetical protein HPP56_09820 [Nitrospirae bacterium]|nr:hypothetical protein [Nitrospirota bacterium]